MEREDLIIGLYVVVGIGVLMWCYKRQIPSLILAALFAAFAVHTVWRDPLFASQATEAVIASALLCVFAWRFWRLHMDWRAKRRANAALAAMN